MADTISRAIGERASAPAVPFLYGFARNVAEKYRDDRYALARNNLNMIDTTSRNRTNESATHRALHTFHRFAENTDEKSNPRNTSATTCILVKNIRLTISLPKYFKIAHTRYFSGDLGRFRRRSSRSARRVRKIYSNRFNVKSTNQNEVPPLFWFVNQVVELWWLDFRTQPREG